MWSQIFSEFGHFWSPPAERSAEHLPARVISAQLGPAHPAPLQDSLPAVLAEVTKLVQRMLGPDITAHQVHWDMVFEKACQPTSRSNCCCDSSLISSYACSYV